MIIFLHFHKAAGSSIITVLKREKKFFSPNKNGNPIYYPRNSKSPITLVYWNKNRDITDKWIKTQEKLGVQVLCLEWNFFNPHNIILDNIEYVICFRDPLKRFYSCLNYESIRQLRRRVTPNQFQLVTIKDQNFIVTYNNNNYYTRMLCGLGESINLKMTEKHLEYAKKVLENFKVIIILENKKSYKLLQNIGIKNTSIPNNDKKTRYYIKKDDIFDKQFIENNKLDYNLYNYAIELSNKQLCL